MPKTHYTTSLLVTVLRLRQEGNTFKQIADHLGSGIKTVQTWYKTALREKEKYEQWRKLND